MFKISNFTDNDDVTVLKEFGAFKTIEWNATFPSTRLPP